MAVGITVVNWNDESQIVETVKKFLIDKGYSIKPKWGQTGPDIQAERIENGVSRILIVEAKGYPSTLYAHGEKSGQEKPTKPETQARHWVADAIFSILLRVSDSNISNIQFALAFPRAQVYITLLNRLKIFREKFNVLTFIVSEDRAVNDILPQQDVS